jgi:hypothetical protein
MSHPASKKMRIVTSIVIAPAICLGMLVTSAPAQITGSFDVASVRIEEQPRNYVRLQPAGQTFVAEGATAATLIRYAYDAQHFQVAGGPDWIYDRDTQFNIRATFTGEATPGRVTAMVRPGCFTIPPTAETYRWPTSGHPTCRSFAATAAADSSSATGQAYSPRFRSRRDFNSEQPTVPSPSSLSSRSACRRRIEDHRLDWA